MGQPIKATLLFSTRQFIVLVPTLLIFPRLFGFIGVLSAMPITDYISSTVTFIFLFISYRQMIERQAEQEEDIIEVLKSKKTI